MILHGRNRFVNMQETLGDGHCSSPGLAADLNGFVRLQILFLESPTRRTSEF
jgi:hypothetical protein